jgi:scyllo-inositol 2-dehydrogenase (NADP+)
MKKKLRVAIIGQGRSGRDIHGKHLLTDTARFTIVAVADELADRRERAVREYGCEAYAGYEQLLSRHDIDLVVNASFSHQHGPITTDLLRHGFNVLVEKPAARSPEELDGMIEAARESGRMLAIFQQSRFAPYFEKVQQILRSGVLGRPVQISISFSGFARRWDWQCCRDMNGGSLFNTGPHPLDQALQLLDYPGMPDVFCRMDRANTFGDAEDYVKLILTAPDRPVIDLVISSCDAYPECTYRIQATRGGLKGTTTRIDWRWYSEAEAPAQRLTRRPLSTPEGLPAYCSEKMVWIEESWQSPDARVFSYGTRRLYDTVYDHLAHGTPLVVTPEQVRQQLAVIAACHAQNPLPPINVEEQ